MDEYTRHGRPLMRGMNVSPYTLLQVSAGEWPRRPPYITTENTGLFPAGGRPMIGDTRAPRNADPSMVTVAYGLASKRHAPRPVQLIPGLKVTDM